MNNKKVIFRGIVSLCAAKATWCELNREFTLGDKHFGKVGPLNTIGRYGIKTTSAVLAYVLTDTALEWLTNAIFSTKTETESKSVKEEDEDEIDESIKVVEDGFEELDEEKEEEE